MSTLNNISFVSYQNDTYKYFNNGVVESYKNMTSDEIIDVLNNISCTLKCIYHLMEYFDKDFDKSVGNLNLENDNKKFLKSKFLDLQNSINLELDKNTYLLKNPLDEIDGIG